MRTCSNIDIHLTKDRPKRVSQERFDGDMALRNPPTLTGLRNDCGFTFTQIYVPPGRFPLLHHSSFGIVQLQPDKFLKSEGLVASPGF